MWNVYSRTYLAGVCIVCSLGIVGKHIKVEKGVRNEEEEGGMKTVSGVQCVSFAVAMLPTGIYGYETKRHVIKFTNFDCTVVKKAEHTVKLILIFFYKKLALTSN